MSLGFEGGYAHEWWLFLIDATEVQKKIIFHLAKLQSYLDQYLRPGLTETHIWLYVLALGPVASR